MSCRRPIAALLSLLCLPLLAQSAAAQAVRSLPQSVVMSHTQLNSEQVRDIQQYLDIYGRQLSSDKSGEVSTARNKLIEPLRVPGVSPVFRNVYSERLMPMLRDTIERGGSQPAVNAMQVAGYLATHQSMQLALQHADLSKEKRAEVRTWAANAVVVAFRQNTITGNLIQQSMQSLSRAAENETDWVVLRRQLSAFRDIPDSQARGVLVDTLSRLMDRLGRQEGPSDLVQGIYPAINSLRADFFAVLDGPAQDALGRRIGPTLGKVLAVAKAHWSAAQNESQAKKSYGTLIDLSEKFLLGIHKDVLKKADAPQTKASQAWEKGDQSAFNAVDAQWSGLLAKAPYR